MDEYDLINIFVLCVPLKKPLLCLIYIILHLVSPFFLKKKMSVENGIIAKFRL